MTRQNAWGGVRRGFFPSLFMSAWWFDADGLSAHYQEPILDFLEAVPGYGDIVRAGRRVARSVGFSPFNRDDPSDWIRQQDRGFAAVKGYHYPSSGNTSRSGNRSLWNSSLGNVSRNWKRSPYRSRRLTKRRNANQWTKRRVRRRIAGRRRVSGGGYRRRKYTGRRRGKYATRSRYRRRRYGVKYRPGRQHLRWKKDIELEEYGRFVLAQLMWINLRRMPSVCPMSPLTYLRVVAACVEACDDPVGYDYLQRVPCCTIDSDRCYQYCSSVP